MSESDQFAFNIQLKTADGKMGFHSKNDGDENQRPDIVDDICRGLLIQARVDRIVHGTETENGKPATLIVFGFRFHGLSKSRRLRTARINILFQDDQKRSRSDPEVIALWPNGDFTLSKTTIAIQNTTGGEIGAQAGVTAAGATITLKLEQQKGYESFDRSTVTGSMLLDLDVRDYGPKNAVRLTLQEDGTNNTGVITDLRAAVLLRRKNNTDRFAAFVNVKASGDFSYNAVKGLRDLLGKAPPNDPVKFSPGTQYLRPGSPSDAAQQSLAADIDEKNLSAVNLNELGLALGTTVIATVIEKAD